MTRLPPGRPGVGPVERRPSDIDLLRELWADRDLTVPEIATRLGIARSTVLKRAAEMRLTPRRPYSRNARRTAADTLAARQTDQARLRELWADPDLPLADIADALGVDRHTVRAWASDIGLPPASRPSRPNTTRSTAKSRAQARLRELWADESLTTAQIAQELGLARGTVSAWATQMKLPARARGRPRA
ncbi:winged helix-turn-helix domain-containing protein [Streptomyces sp. NRRL F-5123]|uniref:winged helix-turn-helix domain-containing protein n=1 Tax=Streptomyces sp. NRRL F-5123 TaxID=1463856 RepID=UPI0004E1674F|nr:winged helix-turn-helix domain-containing protein [Streptomyces sp. NRRL F-5123]